MPDRRLSERFMHALYVPGPWAGEVLRLSEQHPAHEIVHDDLSLLLGVEALEGPSFENGLGAFAERLAARDQGGASCMVDRHTHA
jgi:hypothetical protein